ncbi:MAG: hypothetical protein KC422_25730 [Trueperaceae bacterium]|nr:hypothetical protein [Trueperaceae bacterium]
MKKPKLAMVGVSCLDHIWQVSHFPPNHSRTHAHAYQVQGGGPAATAAVTGARLGADVRLLTVHGDDSNGQLAKLELERSGVDLSYLRTYPNSQMVVSSILVTPEGERYIFPYMGNNLLDTDKDLDFSILEGVDCLVTDSGYPIMNKAILKAAKTRNIPIVADFGHRRNWHLATYADYLIVSEECATEVLGRNDPEAALDALKQFETQYVGITLGEEGYLFTQASRTRHIPAFPVEVVDTTGAGDVFHGAFAYAVARGFDLDYCGLFASVTASLSCTALGGRAGIPDAATVEAILQEQNFREAS